MKESYKSPYRTSVAKVKKKKKLNLTEVDIKKKSKSKSKQMPGNFKKLTIQNYDDIFENKMKLANSHLKSLPTP